MTTRSALLLVISFCVIGLFVSPIGGFQVALLLASLISLILLKHLERHLSKVEELFYINASDNCSKLLAYSPLAFVAAAWFWMFDPKIGIGAFCVALSVAALKLYESLLLRRQFLKNHERLCSDLSAQPFELVVHVSGPVTSSYQVNQWVPVLEQLPFRTAIIGRHLALCSKIKGGSIPVIHARKPEHVSQIINSGVRGVLYPGNGIHNSQVLRHIECKHIFINHGESDKVVNQSKFLMAYDYLFVGGQLAKDRLIDAGLPIRDNQVVFVGRPQAEMALEKEIASKDIANILYAPTWEGFTEEANFGSVRDWGLAIVQQLAQLPNVSVTFKPHPMTGTRCKKTMSELKRINAFCAQEDIPVLGKDDSLHSAMNQSDVLITDISSVLNEYLVTEKPVILCNASDETQEKLARTYPSSRAAYILGDPGEVINLITSIKISDDLRSERQKVLSYSLGRFPNGALAEFTEQLARVTNIESK
ncbi:MULTISPECIES: CDP-glycerol glycerophosphotransferase family protein [Halocynthiibacter]|uniref:CDP-glycerol glycerophosphotransferase family protein n=1 Tax=Halocynthiibacter halioticoli TaxID=2986804 RepID=A0AAE3J260_9RHOB|nr:MULTISPECIES: CDP-glycerol glycerophosphotransferase family protein [Halocynthiibacter]MCV6825410.1 CDP-glycerol glycerophosphotransferase family protein [Halocynthiibacter halioticoli]MCW4058411.1 CDP-glycerol glycerophosphotransferase family protein [Halocynthiibacter sp. SDUM655004]